jgi:hypothetical protein
MKKTRAIREVFFEGCREGNRSLASSEASTLPSKRMGELKQKSLDQSRQQREPGSEE